YLSRGHSHNEMTQFRYNVLLHIEDKSKNSNSPTLNAAELTNQRNWKLNPISVEATKKYLLEIQPDLLLINNITNSRVDAAVKTADWLHRQEAPKTVGRMREVLENSTNLAIDPQDWWDLEAVLPYSVEITWSMQAEIGDYDVLLVRHGVNARVHLSRESIQITTTPGTSYTNHPLQANFARQLIPKLRQYLRQTLPDYMLPACFVPLTTLPLTVSGKVNRRLLSTLHKDSIDSSNTASNISSNAGVSTASPSRESPLLTSIETSLSEIWKDLLRLKQVNREDNFFELGGHSLLATQMISRIRDVFGLDLPLKSVFEAPTIAQLAPLLETLRNTTSVSSLPPLVRLDRSPFRHKRVSSVLDSEPSIKTVKTDSSSSIHHSSIHQIQNSLSSDHSVITTQRAVSVSRSPLILLTQGGSQSPFFCVHPMFGVVFPYLELAHHLGDKRSFYGLQPLGLDGTSPPLTRIETIAAHYIQAIQTIQPHGPYFLGGWSFGGLVAFEMAQQLTQAGQQIGLLAILDTPAPCYQSSGLQSLKFLLGTALWSTLPFLLDYSALLTHRWQSWNSWFSRWQWLTLVRQIPEESQLPLTQESAIAPMLRIVYANAQAAYRYVPQPYGDRVTLFKASEQPDSLQQNSTLGWNTLANDIQLHLIPGNHLSLLKHPQVQILAERLGQCLSEKNLKNR
ncbi:MAG TPA: thioesterase domain-containing protein, partial [Allocoleopsis sp.]